MKKQAFWHTCIVMVALGSLGSGSLLAQSTTDCPSVVDDMARLKCYDEQAARQKKKAAPAPAAAAATPAPARPTPPARPEPATSSPGDFGLEADVLRKKQVAANPEAPKAPEQVVGRVKAVATKAGGSYRVTLEDGQVWEETQHIGGQPPEVGETVTIKRGLLGSYFLARAFGLALRVKRID